MQPPQTRHNNNKNINERAMAATAAAASTTTTTTHNNKKSRGMYDRVMDVFVEHLSSAAAMGPAAGQQNRRRSIAGKGRKGDETLLQTEALLSDQSSCSQFVDTTSRDYCQCVARVEDNFVCSYSCSCDSAISCEAGRCDLTARFTALVVVGLVLMILVPLVLCFCCRNKHDDTIRPFLKDKEYK
jgi:hypothetical protein